MDYALVFGILAGLIVLKIVLRRLFWRRYHAGGGVGFLARRLGATPEQKRVLEDEADAIRAAFGGARGEWRATRDDARAVLGSDSFDKDRVAATFRRQDDLLVGIRRQLVESFERVHAALSPEQRQKLVAMATTRGGWHHRHACGGHGPCGGHGHCG